MATESGRDAIARLCRPGFCRQCSDRLFAAGVQRQAVRCGHPAGAAAFGSGAGGRLCRRVVFLGLVVHSRNTDDDISVKQSSSETPSGDTVYKKGSYDDYADDFIFPGSDERYLSENELADLNSEDTQQAINEIYARRGRIFKEEPYKSFFNGCKWYKPTYSAEEFKDKWFNEYEKKNIQLLSSHRDNVSVNIDSENAAIQYALDYCKENYNDIDIPIVDVKVLDVDLARNRIQLSMLI